MTLPQRKPLNRYTPLKPGRWRKQSEAPGTLSHALNQRKKPIRPVSKKRAEEDRQDKPAYDALLAEAVRCAVCWCPNNGVRRFDRHHVRGRVCRERNHPHNVMVICEECHDGFHAKPDDKNGLRPCHAVWVQQEIYGDELDMALLNRLGIKRVEAEPLPEFYQKERRKNS